MAYTTINKSTDYFNTKLYTGNGGTNALTGVGFQPDLTWIKERGATGDHFWCDAVRGVTKYILSNAAGAEGTNANTLTAFGTDGFTLGSDGWTNNNSDTYASWNWKANGQGSSNTAGTINTTYTSVNTTAGFSIIKYTGNGTANATIGHGLGVEPAMILFKRTDSSNNWIVYQKTMGTGHYLTLNTTGAKDSASGAWCTPSSTLIQLNQVFGATNTNSATYIAYCFAEKSGYSKFGSYVGNGNNDNGTFVYTGFKPSFVLVKRTSGTEQWQMTDSVRDKNVSPNFARLNPDANSAESANITWARIDKFSNGFRLGGNDTVSNGSGSTYIYMAFGQSIVGSNNIPATAR